MGQKKQTMHKSFVAALLQSLALGSITSRRFGKCARALPERAGEIEPTVTAKCGTRLMFPMAG